MPPSQALMGRPRERSPGRHSSGRGHAPGDALGGGPLPAHRPRHRGQLPLIERLPDALQPADDCAQRHGVGLPGPRPGTRPAARYSGIAVTRTCLLLFAMAGVYSAVAAIFYLGNFNTARADMAFDQVLPAVTVAILGGVSAYGGTGTIPGVVLALVLLS